MRKLFFILTVAAALILTSCNGPGDGGMFGSGGDGDGGGGMFGGGGTGGGGYGGGGGGGSGGGRGGGLTFSDWLPSSDFEVDVVPDSLNGTTWWGLSSEGFSQSLAWGDHNDVSGNTVKLYEMWSGTIWTDSGTYKVILHDVDREDNYYYYMHGVSFSNGSATISKSNMEKAKF